MARISFSEHPASVGETYVEHLCAASGFGVAMIGGGIACLVHALLPFFFVRTGSQTIGALNERMITNRRRAALIISAADRPLPRRPASKDPRQQTST